MHLETTSERQENKRETPQDQIGEPQDSEWSKSAPNPEVYRSDRAENSEKENIQGVGLRTL